MASLIYGSSLSDPNYANFRGSQTGQFVGSPMSSQTNPLAANYTGKLSNGQTLGSLQIQGASNMFNPGTGGSGTNNTSNPNGLISASQGDTNSQIQSLNTQFDQNAESLRNQIGSLDSQYNDTQNFYTQQQGLLSGQVNTSKQQAQDNAANNQADALATAQDVQRQNRNMLRALGILSSSAGGDILSRPMGEYEKVRGQIAQQLSGRLNELNDFMNQKTSELSFAAQQARSQYDSLKNQIQSDLRFNDRQRADAINQANQALISRIADIRNTLSGYATQTANAQSQIANYINTLKQSNPGAINTGSISDTTLSGTSTGVTPVTASIYDPNKKNLLSGIGN